MITFTTYHRLGSPCFSGLGEKYSTQLIKHLEAEAASANITSEVHLKNITLDRTWGDAVGIVCVGPYKLVSKWAAKVVSDYMDDNPIPQHGYECQRSRGPIKDVEFEGHQACAVPTYYFPGCD